MVMYRDFAMRRGRKLKLTGFVENMEDGRVHLIAEGEELSLANYIQELKKGSILAYVEDVEVQWSDMRGEQNTFSILYR